MPASSSPLWKIAKGLKYLARRRLLTDTNGLMPPNLKNLRNPCATTVMGNICCAYSRETYFDKTTPLTIPDVTLMEPQVFGDEWGVFFETFEQGNMILPSAGTWPWCKTTTYAQAKHVMRVFSTESSNHRANWCA